MGEKSTARIYLDYAAATPLDAEVARAMRAWEDAHFANASSIHSLGRDVRRDLEDARFKIAAHLGVRSNECIFTAGATSATMSALHGTIGHLLEKDVAYRDMHIVMSAIEHSSVRSCVETFMRRGVRVSIAPVEREGVVDLDALTALLRDDTVLVLSMLVNNEIGTIAPVQRIAKALETRYAAGEHRFAAHGMKKPLLFVDASQAPLYMHVPPNAMSADLMVLDAHKLYGPKQTGLLFIRSNIPFVPLCGTHGSLPYEGTPDVAAILGFVKAYSIAEERRAGDAAAWRTLKERLLASLSERIKGVRVHGDPKVAVPGIVNVSFPDIEGEFLAAQLDAHGIAASAKSACLSGGTEGSYVVQAIDPTRANNSIRFSFGRGTTEDDIDVLVSVLSDIIPPA